MRPLVIDIGAASGKMTTKWSSEINRGIFYCIEPLPRNFANLSSALKDKSNVHLHNVAINDVEGMLDFHECPYPNSSSLLPFDEESRQWKHPKGTGSIEFTNTKIIKVKSIRLDTFLKENNLVDCVIDFIKVDTQGNDLKVVKSLGDFIFNVREIMLEVQIIPCYKNQSKKKDILAYMASKGFKEYQKNKQSFGQEENIWFINEKFSYFLHLN